MIDPLARSEHQRRVDEFCFRAGQEVPQSPDSAPSQATKLLRARLILEEALETIRDMGLGFFHNGEHESPMQIMDTHQLEVVAPFELIGTVDGCADLLVVTTGTLSALGVSDMAIMREVDINNLKKFGPGSYKDSFGKHCKPPNHHAPDIGKLIEAQRFALLY